MLLTQINDDTTAGGSFTEVGELLAESPQPCTLRFVKAADAYNEIRLQAVIVQCCTIEDKPGLTTCLGSVPEYAGTEETDAELTKELLELEEKRVARAEAVAVKHAEKQVRRKVAAAEVEAAEQTKLEIDEKVRLMAQDISDEMKQRNREQQDEVDSLRDQLSQFEAQLTEQMEAREFVKCVETQKSIEEAQERLQKQRQLLAEEMQKQEQEQHGILSQVRAESQHEMEFKTKRRVTEARKEAEHAVARKARVRAAKEAARKEAAKKVLAIANERAEKAAEKKKRDQARAKAVAAAAAIVAVAAAVAADGFAQLVLFDGATGCPINDSARQHCVDIWTGTEQEEGTEERPALRVDYEVIKIATGGFDEQSHLIGLGGSCKVYRGKVYGHSAAIKVRRPTRPCPRASTLVLQPSTPTPRMDLTRLLQVFNEASSKWDDKQFAAEVDLLSRIQHPHINRLLCVSHNGPRRCLVSRLQV
jgi:hypothetical protein